MSQDTKFDFTKAVSEIEEINQWFQNEDIDLDEGLAKFRRGLELIKKCQTRLKQVENEFTEIKKEFNVEEKQNNEVEIKP
ncbi:exodeoxyribonuclease VII small subunit [Candidatus Gottesmanbacteria bacterium]|nr:exodeoxyribonuclease VII small subunit [Candidatus Gottesmanbacteria bacterium]